MKELSIEEKAERYDNAIKIAKSLYDYNQPISASNVIINNIFPELKESGDEKIRKWIIKQIKTYDPSIIRDEALVWLEKQGEQEPVDKAEPKFKVGDWVVSPNGVYWHIDKISNNRYEVTSSTGESSDWNLDTNIYHRFTIQDAKDGDVLVCENGWTCIFNCLNNNLFSSHCFMDDEGWFCEDGGQVHTLDNRICGEIHPATKEQYDQFEKAMVNAGYKWNKKERKLEKIEQKHTSKHKIGDTVYYDSFGRLVSFVIANIVEDGTDNPMYEDKEGNAIFEKDLIEQKPAWSEEDEYYYGIVQYILNNECVGKADRENAITWYNFLKDRVQPQPKQEWSEEDEKCCSIVIAEFSKCAGKSVSKDEWMRCNDWLNSLRDRVQPKQEWNEEDEDMLYKATAVINRLCAEGKEYVWSIKTLKKLFFWLKSLRPQSQWKPSDEQIKAIKWIIVGDNPENWSVVLKNLYQNLKKLKG